MFTKIYNNVRFLALLGIFGAIILFTPSGARAVENIDITQAADKVISVKILPAGFYQFNNLEIFKGPSVDELPATIEIIQKNEKSCIVYENGKTDAPLSCLFNSGENNRYTVQIEERTTLLGIEQNPALLTDFEAGNHINILGWLSADSKTIRAAVMRNLEKKDYHQSLSGTIKKIHNGGFVLVLNNGDEVFVETPLVEGAQITVKGVFDKVNNAVNNVLSVLIRPTIVLKAEPTEDVTSQQTSTPAAKPSTLFKNFLKIFGL